MEGFTIFDGVVAGVIVISAILAYSRGFVRETLSIAGWVAAAVIAFTFADRARNLMYDVPYLGDFLNGSCELAAIAAFAAVFAVALVVISLFTPLFSSVVQKSALGTVDAGLGFLFGAARGVLLVVVILIVYDKVVGNEPIAMISDSRSAEIFLNAQTRLEEQIPDEAPGWIVERYQELMNSNCGEAGGT